MQMMVMIGGKHTRGREKGYAEELIKVYRENKEGGEMQKTGLVDLMYIQKRLSELSQDADKTRYGSMDSIDLAVLSGALEGLSSIIEDVIREEAERRAEVERSVTRPFSVATPFREEE